MSPLVEFFGTAKTVTAWLITLDSLGVSGPKAGGLFGSTAFVLLFELLSNDPIR